MEGGLVAHKVSNSSFSCPKRAGGTANYDNRPADNASQSVIMAWYNQIINSWSTQSSNYCEFRDNPAADDPLIRGARFYLKITDAEKAQYFVSNQSGGGSGKIRLWINGTESDNPVRFDLEKGESRTIELVVATRNSVANYEQGGNENVSHVIEYGRPGNANNFCLGLTIIDDDNSAYVGGLNKHPYGGSWMKNKPCYERDCARNDSNF